RASPQGGPPAGTSLPEPKAPEPSPRRTETRLDSRFVARFVIARSRWLSPFTSRMAIWLGPARVVKFRLGPCRGAPARIDCGYGHERRAERLRKRDWVSVPVRRVEVLVRGRPLREGHRRGRGQDRRDAAHGSGAFRGTLRERNLDRSIRGGRCRVRIRGPCEE